MLSLPSRAGHRFDGTFRRGSVSFYVERAPCRASQCARQRVCGDRPVFLSRSAVYEPRKPGDLLPRRLRSATCNLFHFCGKIGRKGESKRGLGSLERIDFSADMLLSFFAVQRALRIRFCGKFEERRELGY